MHCSACATLIERSLQKVEGVEQATVNFTAEKASVVVSSNTHPNTLIQAVKNAGYDARMLTNEDRENEKRMKANEYNVQKRQLIASILLSLPMLVFMIFDFFPFLRGAKLLFPYMGIVSFILTTPVLFILGNGFYKGAFAALRMKSFNMDSLIAIGTTVAYIYSVVNYGWYIYTYQTMVGLAGEKIPELYFETAAFLITFVLLGKLLEHQAKGKTSHAIEKLMGLQEKSARLVVGTEYKDVHIDDVQKNDVVMVRPGERIPIDGIILKGNTSVDESMITGESIPVEKHMGEKVIGGTINKHGSIEYKVTATSNETILSHIVRLVEDAQGSKAPIQDFADKISSYFVPIVITIAMFTFFVWFIVLHATLSFALMAFTSVIVIACPCALGLATPTAIMVGTGKGAEHGILIKGGEPLQAMERINTIVFDKTGTITHGKPVVTDMLIVRSNESETNLVSIAASLEKHSEHPLAEALLLKAKTLNVTLKEVNLFKAYPGKGIEGTITAETYYFGNISFMREIGFSHHNQNALHRLESMGKTVMSLADKKGIIGYIAVADTIKDSSKTAIERLKNRHIEVWMITGDNERTAQAIAQEVGIEHVIAGVLPQDKAQKIRKLQQKGKRVAMVGDGVNDAPALATADLGIVMGKAADVAMETGGVVLMRNDLSSVNDAMDLSRETMGKIRQNMFFALFYNVIGIPIAARALSYFGLVLMPELAGAAMALSSISVVSNSLLLRFFSPRKTNYVSLAAPLFMGIIFLTLFVSFAKVSSGMSSMGTVVVSNDIKRIATAVLKSPQIKNAFLKDSPKLFIATTPEDLQGLRLQMGTPSLKDNEMVVGYEEGMMMVREGLIKKPGDIIDNFFGIRKIKVSGILAPTNTMLDMFHIMNDNTFNTVKAEGILFAKIAPDNSLKLFFVIENEIPPILVPYISRNKLTRSNPVSVYVGIDEAKMMIAEKIFTKKGDRVNAFFGNNIEIAGIVPKTNTWYDHMHIVGTTFVR